MKRIGNRMYAVAILVLLFLLAGCRIKPENDENKEVSMKKYYVMEDFESVSIGVSSYKDVYEIVPGPMGVTSYGGFCEFPTKDGGCIRIKFEGKDLIVFSIEEVNDHPIL